MGILRTIWCSTRPYQGTTGRVQSSAGAEARPRPCRGLAEALWGRTLVWLHRAYKQFLMHSKQLRFYLRVASYNECSYDTVIRISRTRTYRTQELPPV